MALEARLLTLDELSNTLIQSGSERETRRQIDKAIDLQDAVDLLIEAYSNYLSIKERKKLDIETGKIDLYDVAWTKFKNLRFGLLRALPEISFLFEQEVIPTLKSYYAKQAADENSSRLKLEGVLKNYDLIMEGINFSLFHTLMKNFKESGSIPTDTILLKLEDGNRDHGGIYSAYKAKNNFIQSFEGYALEETFDFDKLFNRLEVLMVTGKLRHQHIRIPYDTRSGLFQIYTLQ